MKLLEAVDARPLRKILHCDCDCFFAAVEMRDDPRLRNRPLAVGGLPERRGVIATCNYEARAYGVRSAMPSLHALRLCPQLMIVPPDMARYRETAVLIRGLFLEYTDLVEPLSLDEAYLDVTRSESCRGSATLMAMELRARVRELAGITISAGVAPSKFLAKVASDWRKPDGLFVITPGETDAFLAALPVERLHGVGAITARRLHELGLHTCGDLRSVSSMELVKRFGRFGQRLAEMACGIDERPVSPLRERKSVSVECTFAQDLPDLDSCLEALSPLEARLRERVARLSDTAAPIHKQVLKMKFDDFRQTTVECLSGHFDSRRFADLCRQSYARGARPVRLLGVGVRFARAPATQLSLFSPSP